MRDRTRASPPPLRDGASPTGTLRHPLPGPPRARGAARSRASDTLSCPILQLAGWSAVSGRHRAPLLGRHPRVSALRHARGRVLPLVSCGTSDFQATDSHAATSTSRSPPCYVSPAETHGWVPIHACGNNGGTATPGRWPAHDGNVGTRRPPSESTLPLGTTAATHLIVSPDSVSAVDRFGQGRV